jgi:hypothetical protein
VVDGAADEEVGAAGNVTEANDDEAEVAVGLAKAELEAAAAWEELGRNAVADAPADEDVVDEVVPAIAEKGSTTGGGKTRPLRPPELPGMFPFGLVIPTNFNLKPTIKLKYQIMLRECFTQIA